MLGFFVFLNDFLTMVNGGFKFLKFKIKSYINYIIRIKNKKKFFYINFGREKVICIMLLKKYYFNIFYLKIRWNKIMFLFLIGKRGDLVINCKNCFCFTLL